MRISDLFDGSGGPIAAKPRREIADRNAVRLWREATLLAGSSAARYLSARGITVASSEVRFHPRMPLGPKGSVKFLPAMVAAVRNDAGIPARFTAPSSTPPATVSQGSNSPSERSAVSVLAQCAWRSHERGALVSPKVRKRAFSTVQLFGTPCWATLGNERSDWSTNPELVRELILFVDNDAGGLLAEERAREAYARKDRRIVIQRPERADEDWNDVLMQRFRAAI